jgi:hypothetical protein
LRNSVPHDYGCSRTLGWFRLASLHPAYFALRHPMMFLSMVIRSNIESKVRNIPAGLMTGWRTCDAYLEMAVSSTVALRPSSMRTALPDRS